MRWILSSTKHASAHSAGPRSGRSSVCGRAQSDVFAREREAPGFDLMSHSPRSEDLDDVLLHHLVGRVTPFLGVGCAREGDAAVAGGVRAAPGMAAREHEVF